LELVVLAVVRAPLLSPVVVLALALALALTSFPDEGEQADLGFL
jgi:hypothetical protein